MQGWDRSVCPIGPKGLLQSSCHFHWWAHPHSKAHCTWGRLGHLSSRSHSRCRAYGLSLPGLGASGGTDTAGDKVSSSLRGCATKKKSQNGTHMPKHSTKKLRATPNRYYNKITLNYHLGNSVQAKIIKPSRPKITARLLFVGPDTLVHRRHRSLILLCVRFEYTVVFGMSTILFQVFSKRYPLARSSTRVTPADAQIKPRPRRSEDLCILARKHRSKTHQTSPQKQTEPPQRTASMLHCGYSGSCAAKARPSPHTQIFHLSRSHLLLASFF